MPFASLHIGMLFIMPKESEMWLTLLIVVVLGVGKMIEERQHK